MTPPATQMTLTGPSALRSLARAFMHFNEFDRFVQGLQAALDQSGHFGQLTIQVGPTLSGAVGRYTADALVLPLASGVAQLGTLQVTPGGEFRQFGPEDLHLMSGLAEFLSVALLQSRRMEAAEKNPELFRFLLNQAPVGIAAYRANEELIIANELAVRWLGGGGVPFAQLQKNSGGFHLRASGKLIYGEARRAEKEAAGDWIVVLQDLTAEQARLLEWVKRETYRALAESGRIGFAFIESAQLQDGVLCRLPALRAALLPGEIAGPYDAHRVGVVLPGLDGLALRARLRKLRGVFGDTAGLRLGYSELGRDGRTPESLLESALQRAGTYEENLRPVLLVHDDSAAVADAFSQVLGKEFRVVKSISPERTRELLTKEVFDGFVTEIELRNGVSGLDLVRFAREKQPGIRPFLTTVQRVRYGLPAGVAEVGAVVLEKPFDVATLTQTMRAKLLD